MVSDAEHSEMDRSNGWIAEMLRVSVFPVTGYDIATHYWHDIVGREPDETRTKNDPYEAVSQGLYEGGNLVFSVKKDRADWLFVPTKKNIAPGFNNIGDAKDAIEKFFPMLEHWIKADLKLKRIALGGIFLDIQDNMNAVNEILGERIKVIRLPRDHKVNDFSLRMNFSKNMKLNQRFELEINEIFNWSGVELKMVKVSTLGGSQDILDSHTFCAARLELDFNSDGANAKEFTRQISRKVYSECIKRIKEFVG